MTDERDTACFECDDSGWVRFECTGDRACGRRQTHPRHEYVEKCPCRPMNRNYQERVDRSRKRAA